MLQCVFTLCKLYRPLSLSDANNKKLVTIVLQNFMLNEFSPPDSKPPLPLSPLSHQVLRTALRPRRPIRHPEDVDGLARLARLATIERVRWKEEHWCFIEVQKEFTLERCC